MRTLLISAAVAATLLFARASFGAPIVDAGVTAPTVATDPRTNPTAFIDAIAEAARSGHWRLLIGLVLIGFIWAIRSWGGALVPWLRTDRGGAVTALIVGVAGAFSTELMDKAPISLSFFLDGIALGCTAAGGWVVIRRIFGRNGKDAGPANGGGARAGAAMVALFACGTLATGCGPVGKRVAQDIAACGLHELPTAVQTALPDVEKALQGSVTDWAQEEASLVAQGLDFAICAVKNAWLDIRSRLPAASVHAEVNPKLLIALDRAGVFLEKRGIHTTELRLQLSDGGAR